jgi:hypothetical protein
MHLASLLTFYAFVESNSTSEGVSRKDPCAPLLLEAQSRGSIPPMEVDRLAD